MRQALVLGDGMLGWMLARRLSREPGVAVRQTQRRDQGAPLYLDAADPDSPLETLFPTGEAPGLIINAIGMTKDRIDEKDPASVARAHEVNAGFPQRLSKAAGLRGARVVHISTDGVFRGRREPYDETCSPDALDAYGRGKAAGEAASRSFMVVRCSIIGPEPKTGRGIFERVASMPAGSSMDGFTDHVWNGVTTLQFAELCLRLLDPGLFDVAVAISPLRHFCPNPSLSKFELVSCIASVMGGGVTVVPAKAPAPLWRVLTSKWTDLNSLVPSQDWPAAVAAQVREAGRSRP